MKIIIRHGLSMSSMLTVGLLYVLDVCMIYVYVYTQFTVYLSIYVCTYVLYVCTVLHVLYVCTVCMYAWKRLEAGQTFPVVSAS